MVSTDIRALLLIDAERPLKYDPIPVSGAPALHDVAGRSPLLRVADRLRESGIFSAVVGPDYFALSRNLWPDQFEWRGSNEDRFWRTAEDTFNDLAQSGAQLVLVVRLGAYAEVDFESMAQAHLSQHCRVSQALHRGQPLEVFCISASRRNDAASLFRSRFSKCRSECPPFIHTGYTNLLADARDLRQLSVDILTLRTTTRPAASASRPGIWIGPEAVIDRDARIVAPAFIGEGARIDSGAVVTRCTSVERGAHVDCGTVVENSSVLPYSYVGAGLDVAHSVVGMGRITNLRRNSSVEVFDRKLIAEIPARPLERLLAATSRFLSTIPKRLLRGSGQAPAQRPGLASALRTSSHVTGTAYPERARETETAGEFSRLAIARRYGDQ